MDFLKLDERIMELIDAEKFDDSGDHRPKQAHSIHASIVTFRLSR